MGVEEPEEPEEPVEPVEPAEPEPVPDDPFAESPVQIDAPMEDKTGTTLGAGVTGPGAAETVQGVPLGTRTALAGQHNWVPIGPRNIGGRVRAIAVEPGDRRIMYAAPASGGVYKSVDGAESWFPLWHDEPSLSMAGLSICRDHPEVIWAATGESRQGRSGNVALPNAGVLRSVDRGVHWTQPNDLEPIRSVRLHAVAAHPALRDVCWAVGLDGVYRTTDGGTTWTHFADTRVFSDVAFARFGAALRLFLVLSGSALVAGPPGPAESRRGVVVRIDNPDDTDANIAAILPAGPPPAGVGADPLLANAGVTPPPGAGARDPVNGKLAIFEDAGGGGANPVLYVAFANAAKNLHGIYRSRNPNAGAATGMTFTALRRAAPFGGEGQGDYNLALGVDPANANNLAFGMQGLYLNRNANANAPAAAHWLLAQMGDLYHLERGHHADHHALVFAEAPAAPFDDGAAAGTIQLWNANDGGVSVSRDWATGASYAATPLPANLPGAALPLRDGVMTWRKRSHGISGTQMYDLTQHPRLPAVLGCGFQDNGSWIGTGGPSWQFVLSADGGFIAFDPDDPYRIIATYQSGVSDVRFPGLLRDALPLLRDGVVAGFWGRDLDDGFLSCDRAAFVAPTYFHPSQPGRVFTARRNRLYGTRVTTGDRWQPEPFGPGIEILHEPTSAGAGSSTLEVHDTPGGRALGFLAQRNTTETREDARRVSRVRSLAGEPFAIPAGQVLSLSFSNNTATGAARKIDVPLAVGPGLPQNATSAELAAYLTREITRLLGAGPPANRPSVSVVPVLWPRLRSVMVVSTASGAASRITIGGDAAPLLDAVLRDYIGAGAHGAAEALPAMVELRVSPINIDEPGRVVDLTGKRLQLTREGATHPVTIIFDTAAPDPARVRIGDLADILRDELPKAGYQVLSGAATWGIRLTATAAGANVTLTGDLVTDLAANQGLDPGATGRTVRINRRNRFDLTQVGAADRHLRAAEAGHQTANQALTPAFLGVTDLTAVTSVELCEGIRRMLRAAPTVRVRCDLDVYPDHDLTPMFRLPDECVVRDVAFGPTGSRVIWVGDESGRLHRSTDDGGTWAPVPAFPASDRFGVVEAIAVAADAPDTVLAGVFSEGTFGPTAALLFRSLNGGTAWTPAGAGVEDANGRRVGVSSIALDPAAPGHVYVGTELGVFRSTDTGSTFTPFNEGLPNAPVVDLAFEPTTRMLRAGLWGRGVHERHVGERAPKDVRLHIRSTALDDGTAQPYPGPDLLATTPAPLRLDASPDVKQTRRDPRRGLLLDGVEFDDELRHEDVREGPAFICVQLHNRGALPTSTARVAVLSAPADDGPPPLGAGLQAALAAGPLAANASFGAWTVVADDLLPDPHNAGHAVVAPGYPRIAVVGAPPRGFAWGAPDLAGHRRMGLLVLCRSAEDALSVGTTDVLDLVRTEAKAAYRECTIVTPAEDGRVVLRATGTTGFRVEAPSPASVGSLANNGPPLGLAVAPAGSLEVPFDRPEPYDLSGAVRGFRVTIDHDVTISFTADELLQNPRRATADEVSAIVNRVLVAARMPVRASAGAFANGSLAVFLNRIGSATFSAAGTAATRLGLTVGQGATQKFTPAGSAGPWDLRPVPSVRELRIVARTPVEIRLGPGIPGLPDPPASTAAEVRAAINRQLLIGGAFGIEASPRRLGLAVRRSASEAAPTRVVTGSYALADLVASAVQIPAPEARAARLRAVAAQDRDVVTAGQRNFLYTRVSNVGTIRGTPARVRIFEIGTTAAPLPVVAPPGASATQPLAVGEAAVVEIPLDLDARASGARVFTLAIVDTAAEPLDPPATFGSLDDAHQFCLDHSGAAIRELVVA